MRILTQLLFATFLEKSSGIKGAHTAKSSPTAAGK